MPYTHDNRQGDEPLHAPSARPASVGRLDDKLESAARRVAVIRSWFYAVVLLVALGGQITGAVETLGLPWYFAVPAVTALELGGVVVMANADVRRRLGERAIGSRLLSAAIAGGAVTFNWLTHDDKKVGGFFAGMSLLGYLVWLMHTENSRRDRLRATGDLPPTTPAYEPVGHWLRHPWVTRRALALAKASPGLGLYPSLEAARAQIRAERRQAALSTVLHRKIRKALDADTADIAVAVYDLDEIARRLSERADYDGLTALIAADLSPVRVLAGNQPAGTRRRRWRRRAAGPDPASMAAAQRLIAEVLTNQPVQQSTSGDTLGVTQASGEQHPALPAAEASGEPAPALPAVQGGDPADAADSPRAVKATAASTPRVNSEDSGSVRPREWEQVQRELAELLPAATNRRALPEGTGRGQELPDLVQTAMGRTSMAAAAAVPAETPEPPSEPKPGSLRAQVYAALDQLVPADDQRDNATLTGLVVEHLGLEPRVRGTVSKYVRAWRAEVASGQRKPVAGRRLRAVPPSS